MLVEVDSSDPAIVQLTFAPEPGGELSIDDRVLRELLAALATVDADERCRALVIRSQPGCFCRGMDLNAMLHDVQAVRRAVSNYAELLRRLREARQVVFALVDGETVGGGVGIACAADVVIATSGSTFALPELYWGLLPGMVLPVLLERVTPQKARRLTLGGAPIDAATAHRWGIVDEVVESADRFAPALRSELRRVFKLRPTAVLEMKRQIARVEALGLREGLLLGSDTIATHLADPEVRAALAAFVEGETPPWFAKPGTSR